MSFMSGYGLPHQKKPIFYLTPPKKSVHGGCHFGSLESFSVLSLTQSIRDCIIVA